MQRYEVVISVGKTVITRTETMASNYEDAQMKVAKLLKIKVRKAQSNAK